MSSDAARRAGAVDDKESKVMSRIDIAAVLVAVATASPLMAAPAPKTTVEANGCRVVVPDAFGEGSVEWVGACVNSAADGAGVLRVTASDGPVKLFYGVMRAGSPVSGYLATDWQEARGPAVSFKGAEAIYSNRRVDDLTVCAIAARGADVAARFYRSKGNASSARYYLGEATRFRACPAALRNAPER